MSSLAVLADIDRRGIVSISGEGDWLFGEPPAVPDAAALVAGVAQRVILCGHSHQPPDGAPAGWAAGGQSLRRRPGAVGARTG